MVNVCVAGATGAVGRTILKVLEERNFPLDKLFPLSSSRSAGTTIQFRGEAITVQDIADFDFSQAQVGLFSPGGAVSAIYAPKAAEKGCVVIDNTSHFRMEPDVPLIIPEVNPQDIAGYTNRGIIANPNCSTTQMLVALSPIHHAVGIERINVATYQAVSGSGVAAIDELTAQSKATLAGEQPTVSVYPKQIAFNCLPQIDVFTENGYTKEEMKMVLETQKILDPNIVVNPTAVRVPAYIGHSEAIHIETRDKISTQEARELLSKAQGITVVDERVDGGYPTAIESEDTDTVFVGRIREDISHARGLNMWVVSSNIRKGAATNTIQIAECLVKDYLT